jgi:hypothetical protein
MKRRITLSIALSLCIGLLALMSSDSTANAQHQQGLFRYYGDAGIVTLGPNQILRIMVAPVAGRTVPTGSVTFHIDGSTYSQSGCNNGACMHTLTSQTTTGPITLSLNQGTSFDIRQTPSSSGVRGEIFSNSPNIQVNALIIDTTTGGVQYSGGVRVAAGDVN